MRARWIVALTGVSLLVTGPVWSCAKQRVRATDLRAEPEPVDSSFASIRGNNPPPTLAEPEATPSLDDATRARIAESAALLDDYFNRVSTEAPDRSDVTAAAPTRDQPADPTPGPALATGGHEQPAPERADTETSQAEQARRTPRLRGVTILSPVLDPATSWPPVPGGAGIVRSGDGVPDFDESLLDAWNESSGTAVATADGSLPSLPSDAPDPVTPSSGLTGYAGTSGANLTPQQRKAALADELVAVLTELAATSEAPYRAGLALAGLEVLSPGALEDLNDSGLLMPHEAEILLAAHDFLTGLAVGERAADAGAAMDVADRVREQLNQTAPLTIPTAALCTRVWGYGQYETFTADEGDVYTFTAGARQPIIIYTEVDRFGRRATVDEEGVAQWVVELSQELQIYHVADDLLVTARAPETDVSRSRAKMRDYYLINQTYLPETLSIGRYHMKVVMRDANKEAVAERIIKFRVIADGPSSNR